MNIKKPQPDDTFVGDRTFAVAGTDEVYTEYGDAPQVTDKGPWTPSDDGRHIQSEDFEHDVTLRVSGDFATDEDRIAYTKWLAAKLNAAPQVPDGMVLAPLTPTRNMIEAGIYAQQPNQPLGGSGNANRLRRRAMRVYGSMLSAAAKEEADETNPELAADLKPENYGPS